MFAILQQYHDFPTSYSKQATLVSWDNIYFGLTYYFQEFFLNYLYYLYITLTPLKYQKVKKQQ